ncbi:MAG: hypothetical protein JXB85_03490 [Anaerolineales bacterium]|nr:hypothetical protein [Anaerolineales bacterium]
MFLKIFAAIAKTIGVLVTIALLTPIAYFAWRAGQPLDRPEFRDLTYYQLLAERQNAYDQLARSYLSSHPNGKVKTGMCFGVEVFVEAVAGLPNSGFYTLAGLFPALKRFVNPWDLQRGYVPMDVTAMNFLPAWWDTFELFLWGLIEHVPHGPVPYCRIATP